MSNDTVQWKKIAENDDLLSYERAQNGVLARIEARKTFNDVWTIFKTYCSETALAYTEEYHAETRVQALQLIASIQRERLLSQKEVQQKRLAQAKRMGLKVKRIFKDYNVEKWHFAVANEQYQNVVYVRDGDVNDVSIILHEKYKPVEGSILQELRTVLGFETSDIDVRQEVYYYSTKNESYQKSAKFGMFFGNMEIGNEMKDEES